MREIQAEKLQKDHSEGRKMKISRKIAGLSMLGTIVLQVAMGAVVAASAVAGAPVKLAQTGPVKLILAVVTLILAILAPTAHAAGEPPVKQVVTRHDPTKWIKDFQVGLRVSLLVLGTLVVMLGMSSQAFAILAYEPTGSFGSKGSSPGQFKEPTGIAINESTGDIYVYDSGNLRVEWFNSTGSKFEGELNGSTSPTGQFAPPASISEYAAHGTLFNLVRALSLLDDL